MALSLVSVGCMASVEYLRARGSESILTAAVSARYAARGLSSYFCPLKSGCFLQSRYRSRLLYASLYFSFFRRKRAPPSRFLRKGVRKLAFSLREAGECVPFPLSASVCIWSESSCMYARNMSAACLTSFAVSVLFFRYSCMLEFSYIARLFSALRCSSVCRCVL